MALFSTPIIPRYMTFIHSLSLILSNDLVVFSFVRVFAHVTQILNAVILIFKLPVLWYFSMFFLVNMLFVLHTLADCRKPLELPK